MHRLKPPLSARTSRTSKDKDKTSWKLIGNQVKIPPFGWPQLIFRQQIFNKKEKERNRKRERERESSTKNSKEFVSTTTFFVMYFFLFEALNLSHCLTGAQKGSASKRNASKISLILEEGQSVVFSDTVEEDEYEIDFYPQVLTLIQDDMDEENIEIIWIH